MNRSAVNCFTYVMFCSVMCHGLAHGDLVKHDSGCDRTWHLGADDSLTISFAGPLHRVAEPTEPSLPIGKSKFLTVPSSYEGGRQELSISFLAAPSGRAIFGSQQSRDPVQPRISLSRRYSGLLRDDRSFNMPIHLASSSTFFPIPEPSVPLGLAVAAISLLMRRRSAPN